MNFFEWLILGMVAYVSGFSIRHFQYKKQTPPKDKLIMFTAICLTVSLVGFTLINLFGLKKPLDVMFIGVSSLVATGIFYYGLATDNSNNMNMPD